MLLATIIIIIIIVIVVIIIIIIIVIVIVVIYCCCRYGGGDYCEIMSRVPSLTILFHYLPLLPSSLSLKPSNQYHLNKIFLSKW